MQALPSNSSFRKPVGFGAGRAHCLRLVMSKAA